MYTERSNIERIISEMARGKVVGDKLLYDRRTKTFRLSGTVDPDQATDATFEDNIFFCGC
jgi:hypothetical protein